MSNSERVATNLRTLMILEAVSTSSEPVTPTEINRAIGLPKQSIHRLCQTMVDEGFLIRDTSGKRLRPSPRTLKMAQGLFITREAQIARNLILHELSRATRETVNFVVPETNGMMYLDRVETDWLFRIELPIGSRVPFQYTASGKCFLASLDERSLEQILGALTFEQRTANSIVDRETLERELDKIREQGFSIDNEELFEGMVALAVPVVHTDGRFFAAVAFHGPTQRLDHETLTKHLGTMQDGARRLAALNA